MAVKIITRAFADVDFFNNVYQSPNTNFNNNNKHFLLAASREVNDYFAKGFYYIPFFVEVEIEPENEIVEVENPEIPEHIRFEIKRAVCLWAEIMNDNDYIIERLRDESFSVGNTNFNIGKTDFNNINDGVIAKLRAILMGSGFWELLEARRADIPYEIQVEASKYVLKEKLAAPNETDGGANIVGYNDYLQQPQLGATTMQQAIDGIKDVALEGNLTDFNVSLTTPDWNILLNPINQQQFNEQVDPLLNTFNNQIQSIIAIIGATPLRFDVGKDNDGNPIDEGTSEIVLWNTTPDSIEDGTYDPIAGTYQFSSLFTQAVFTISGSLRFNLANPDSEYAIRVYAINPSDVATLIRETNFTDAAGIVDKQFTFVIDSNSEPNFDIAQDRLYVEVAFIDSGGGAGTIQVVGADTNNWKITIIDAPGIELDLSAINITYDNSISSLTSENVQTAIDELDNKVETNKSDIVAINDRIDTYPSETLLWSGSISQGNNTSSFELGEYDALLVYGHNTSGDGRGGGQPIYITKLLHNSMPSSNSNFDRNQLYNSGWHGASNYVSFTIASATGSTYQSWPNRGSGTLRSIRVNDTSNGLLKLVIGIKFKP